MVELEEVPKEALLSQVHMNLQNRAGPLLSSTALGMVAVAAVVGEVEEEQCIHV